MDLAQTPLAASTTATARQTRAATGAARRGLRMEPVSEETHVLQPRLASKATGIRAQRLLRTEALRLDEPQSVLAGQKKTHRSQGAGSGRLSAAAPPPHSTTGSRVIPSTHTCKERASASATETSVVCSDMNSVLSKDEQQTVRAAGSARPVRSVRSIRAARPVRVGPAGTVGTVDNSLLRTDTQTLTASVPIDLDPWTNADDGVVDKENQLPSKSRLHPTKMSKQSKGQVALAGAMVRGTTKRRATKASVRVPEGASTRTSTRTSTRASTKTHKTLSGTVGNTKAAQLVLAKPLEDLKPHEPNPTIPTKTTPIGTTTTNTTTNIVSADHSHHSEYSGHSSDQSHPLTVPTSPTQHPHVCPANTARWSIGNIENIENIAPWQPTKTQLGTGAAAASSSALLLSRSLSSPALSVTNACVESIVKMQRTLSGRMPLGLLYEQRPKGSSTSAIHSPFNCSAASELEYITPEEACHGSNSNNNSMDKSVDGSSGSVSGSTVPLNPLSRSHHSSKWLDKASDIASVPESYPELRCSLGGAAGELAMTSRPMLEGAFASPGMSPVYARGHWAGNSQGSNHDDDDDGDESSIAFGESLVVSPTVSDLLTAKAGRNSHATSNNGGATTLTLGAAVSSNTAPDKLLHTTATSSHLMTAKRKLPTANSDDNDDLFGLCTWAKNAAATAAAITTPSIPTHSKSISTSRYIPRHILAQQPLFSINRTDSYESKGSSDASAQHTPSSPSQSSPRSTDDAADPIRHDSMTGVRRGIPVRPADPFENIDLGMLADLPKKRQALTNTTAKTDALLTTKPSQRNKGAGQRRRQRPTVVDKPPRI
ncbi:hypothetical protein BASA50_002697 [Batrachochytrium salamandrivorans]|uniref:Shugoshin C-terminal domain-containing protein n=1 Tax=Batrachochytrium salamandrivorans TaxID=1357716 RepID=A0ABQ8FLS7_9FUNG|nr:hypothetical protein BASA50_002697 [Batrachochytrium salamandrivorans]